VLLGTQLKAEGNCLYEEDEYSAAVELYTAAIDVGISELERHDTTMAEHRLSTFFSNRAACFIKMVLLNFTSILKYKRNTKKLLNPVRLVLKCVWFEVCESFCCCCVMLKYCCLFVGFSDKLH